MKAAPVLLLLFLIACGGPNVAATGTRAAEVTQVAAVTAPTATTAAVATPTSAPEQPVTPVASIAPLSTTPDTAIGSAPTPPVAPVQPTTAPTPPANPAPAASSAPPPVAPPAPAVTPVPPTVAPVPPTVTPVPPTATATPTTARPTPTPAPRVPTPTAISKGLLRSAEWRWNGLPMPGGVRSVGEGDRAASFWWSGTDQAAQQWLITNWAPLGLKPDYGRSRPVETGEYMLLLCSSPAGTAAAKCVSVFTIPAERITPANNVPFGAGSVYVRVSDGR